MLSVRDSCAIISGMTQEGGTDEANWHRAETELRQGS